ncbi:MAG: DUF4384 domain-containing protein [Prevotella sp.]|nr:DUF4384 domain-containing protein [Prevotella sp.]
MRQAVVLILMMLSITAFAQKVKTVEGEYTYYAPENVTVEEVRRTALERAKIQAIADEFGTIVQQTNTTRIHTNDNKSSTDFFMIGGSEVKGEWIETLGEPQFSNPVFQDHTIVITCKVRGKAREIVTAQIDFKARVLRNGTEDKFEDDDFKSGDDLFLSFVSPVSGYLAVYLVDSGEKAFCLLPYRNQVDGIYPIEANRRYLFFNIKEASQQERPFVDEYNMTCEHSMEHNVIYVVFSPNQFAKAADSTTSELLPRELSYDDFQRWLANCRKHDHEMIPRRIPIVIKK